MCCENKKSLICSLVEGTYKFFYDDGSDPLKNKKVVKPKFSVVDKTIQSILVIGDFAFEGIYLDDDGVLCYCIPFCKHCGSFNVIRKDSNKREIYNSNGELLVLNLKRYECKNCGKKSQTELYGVYDRYCRISNSVKNFVGLSLHNGYKTLRQQAKDITMFTGVPISHETARKSLFTNNGECYKKWDFEISGYSAYDAQWLPTNGKILYRLVLIDIESYLPIAEAIVEKEDEKTIFDFIDKSIPLNKRKGIITDSQIGYSDVMSKLGFKYHQHCIFHLLQRINKLINDEIREFKKRLKKELKDLNPDYSEYMLDKIVKDEAKKYRKIFTPFLDSIKEIFKQETYDDAISCIESIRKQINEFPDFLAEYLIDNFFPIYKRYIVYLQNEVKNHLEKTNNKCENYIGKILDKAHKSNFKTKRGRFDFILHRVNGWIENQLSKKTLK